jgi:riboflavin kinase
MRLAGRVTTGLGKGAYYIGMDVYQDRFHDLLGFYPYPGTLNLDVDTAQRATFQDRVSCMHIEAPKHDGEYMSAVDVYPVTVTAETTDETIEGALLDLAITDHPASVAEIIAPINLREKFGLDDGDTVVVERRT